MLYGSTTTLRAPKEEDVPLLSDIRNDFHLQGLLASRARGSTPQRVREWIAGHLSNTQTIFFAIADKDTDAAVGYLQLVELDFINGIGELGICLHPSKQGKGYAKEALTLLERYVQDTFNLRKIVLKVLIENTNATAFYQHIGFCTVGVYRQHFYYQGAFHDVMIMEKMLSGSGENYNHE